MQHSVYIPTLQGTLKIRFLISSQQSGTSSTPQVTPQVSEVSPSPSNSANEREPNQQQITNLQFLIGCIAANIRFKNPHISHGDLIRALKEELPKHLTQRVVDSLGFRVNITVVVEDMPSKANEDEDKTAVISDTETSSEEDSEDIASLWQRLQKLVKQFVTEFWGGNALADSAAAPSSHQTGWCPKVLAQSSFLLQYFPLSLSITSCELLQLTDVQLLSIQSGPEVDAKGGRHPLQLVADATVNTFYDFQHQEQEGTSGLSNSDEHEDHYRARKLLFILIKLATLIKVCQKSSQMKTEVEGNSALATMDEKTRLAFVTCVTDWQNALSKFKAITELCDSHNPQENQIILFIQQQILSRLEPVLSQIANHLVYQQAKLITLLENAASGVLSFESVFDYFRELRDCCLGQPPLVDFLLKQYVWRTHLSSANKIIVAILVSNPTQDFFATNFVNAQTVEACLVSVAYQNLSLPQKMQVAAIAQNDQVTLAVAKEAFATGIKLEVLLTCPFCEAQQRSQALIKAYYCLHDDETLADAKELADPNFQKYFRCVEPRCWQVTCCEQLFRTNDAGKTDYAFSLLQGVNLRSDEVRRLTEAAAAAGNELAVRELLRDRGWLWRWWHGCKEPWHDLSDEQLWYLLAQPGLPTVVCESLAANRTLSARIQTLKLPPKHATDITCAAHILYVKHLRAQRPCTGFFGVVVRCCHFVSSIFVKSPKEPKPKKTRRHFEVRVMANWWCGYNRKEEQQIFTTHYEEYCQSHPQSTRDAAMRHAHLATEEDMFLLTTSSLVDPRANMLNYIRDAYTRATKYGLAEHALAYFVRQYRNWFLSIRTVGVNESGPTEYALMALYDATLGMSSQPPPLPIFDPEVSASVVHYTVGCLAKNPPLLARVLGDARTSLSFKLHCCTDPLFITIVCGPNPSADQSLATRLASMPVPAALAERLQLPPPEAGAQQHSFGTVFKVQKQRLDYLRTKQQSQQSDQPQLSRRSQSTESKVVVLPQDLTQQLQVVARHLTVSTEQQNTEASSLNVQPFEDTITPPGATPDAPPAVVPPTHPESASHLSKCRFFSNSPTTPHHDSDPITLPSVHGGGDHYDHVTISCGNGAGDPPE